MRLRDLAVALVVPIAIAAVLSQPAFDRLQGLSLDLLMVLRNGLLPNAVAPPSPSVAVIAIDEATYRSDMEPFRSTPRALWTRALAEVLDAVVTANAAVVGFDLVLPRSVKTFDRKFELPFRRALRRAATADKIVLGKYQLGAHPEEPHQEFVIAVNGQGNVRWLNAAVDGDGVIRAMPLQFRSTEGGTLEPSMSLEIASRLLGVEPELESGDGSLRLGAFRIPALPDPQLTVADGSRDVALKNDLLVDLSYGPASFQTYSLLDLYLCLRREGNQAFFDRNFAGKAVMLGLTTELEDRKLTSVRFAQRAEPARPVERCATEAPPRSSRKPRQLVPGVYLQAAAISNLVDGNVLRPLARHEQAVLGAVVALLVAAATMQLSSLLAGLAFAIISLCWVGIALAVFATGIVAPLIQPIAAGGLTLASLLGYRFAVTDRAARHIRRAFGRILAPSLVERMVETRQMPSQGGELRQTTVWFADLQNYTTLSEALAPPNLVAVLNRIYTVMSNTVEEHGGFVAQFQGDAVIASFNVPLDDPDHARHGVEAALSCCRRVDDLGRTIDLPRGFELRIRIGISTGDVLAGYIGSERRLSYTVIGDDINLASRLEGVNKIYGSTILVNEVTRELCGPDIAFREIDVVRVKGRDGPVRIFEPLGPAGEVTARQRAIAERFAEGLALFRDRRFTDAAALFEALAAEDPVSRSFAVRAREFAEAPPPEDWDGVNNLLTK